LFVVQSLRINLKSLGFMLATQEKINCMVSVDLGDLQVCMKQAFNSDINDHMK